MSASNNPTPEPIDQRQHEELCEYLFGELDEARRREVEAELERSPELRAERERLEATVGLVRQALPAEELSEEVQATLRVAAARGPANARRARFRYLRGGGGALAAAAAIVLFVGGVFLARPLWMQAPRMGETARAPEESPYAYDILGLDDRGKASDRLAQAPQSAAAPERQEGKENLAKLEQARKPDQQRAQEADSFDQPFESEFLFDALGAEGGYTGVEAEEVREAPARDFAVGAELLVAEALEDGLYKGPGDSPPPGAVSAPEPSMPTTVGIAGEKGGEDKKSRGRASGDGEAAEVRLRAIGYTSGDPDDLDVHSWIDQDDEADTSEPQEKNEARRKLARESFEEQRGDRFGGQAGRRLLAPEEVTELTDTLLAATRIQPGETPGDMFFRNWGVNPFVLTAQDNLSTFGIDVDTASYTLARRMLNNGIFPGVDQVRTEEFVNYFRADQPAPAGGEVFAIGLELAPSLFGSDPDVDLLRVTVRGKDVDAFDRQPLALTFVVDVSGSMKDGGRLELVKEGLLMLLGQLSVTDSVAVIAFSKETRLVSPMRSAGTRGAIEDAILELTPDGGTDVESGLTLGFEVAAAHLTPHAVNRVVLFSDGVGNIGETDQNRILEKVAGHRAQGIYLNTFGVGLGNHNETFLEQLANRGDGICQYIDSAREAERALVQGFTQAMQPIARDVKIQVEFDPARVERYRLLGYENRAIADHRFRDDAVDAGEVNAGHQVTALYELVRTSSVEGPLATVRVRFKPPFAVDRGALSSQAAVEAEKAVEIERSIGTHTSASFAGASAGYRRSVLVAQFAELLRRSVHARGDSLDTLLEETTKLESELRDPDVTEFLGLVKLAAPQLRARAANETEELATLLHRLSELHFELGQLELLAEAGDEAENAPVQEALRSEIERLEQALRDLVQNRYAPFVDPAVRALEELGYGADEDR